MCVSWGPPTRHRAELPCKEPSRAGKIGLELRVEISTGDRLTSGAPIQFQF
jgi:hypothetical protein